MISDGNSSLRSGDFVRVGDERTSPTSYARTFECAGLMIGFQCTFIISTPRTSVIYFKPKIHKPNNPGRPIVSAYSCRTELISQYLDQIMSPFVKSLPSYIKDTNHALKTFRDFNFPGQNKLGHNLVIYSYPQPRRTSGTQIFFRPTRKQRT